MVYDEEGGEGSAWDAEIVVVALLPPAIARDESSALVYDEGGEGPLLALPTAGALPRHCDIC